MLVKFSERLKERALSKFIAMLPRFSGPQILRLVHALQADTKRRHAEFVIDDYLADPEEAGAAGNEIARNAELCRESERAGNWCEQQGLAYGSHERNVPLEEVAATIDAGVLPGRLSRDPLPPCEPHKDEIPLMQPDEFRRLKLASWEESQRRVPVAGKIARKD